MAQFPLPYQFEVNKTVSYATREVVFESQKKQIQQLAQKPVIDWEIECRGTIDDLRILEEFFDSVGGNTRSFTFLDEYDQPQTVRFKENKLSYKILREFSPTSGTKGTAVGFTATIGIEKVI